MKLAPKKILRAQWQRVILHGPHLVLMRHAPKAGGNESGLSEPGRKLAREYGCLLDAWWHVFSAAVFAPTEKQRTQDTLRLVFSKSNPKTWIKDSRLDSPQVTRELQQAVDELHKSIGRWRGYSVNHTHYFLEELGGIYDGERLREQTAQRMVLGLGELLNKNSFVIHCGHSPSLEAACERMLGTSLSQIGGFLNPLDSIHIGQANGSLKFLARINPIVGYVDAEAKSYLTRG